MNTGKKNAIRPNKNLSTVGDRIRETRKSLGLSQEQLAKELPISRSHISNIENGNDNPSEAILQIFSMKFGVYYTWLATGEGYMRPDYMAKVDSDLMTRYNEGKDILDRLLEQRTDEDYKNSIQAFFCMTEILQADRLDANKKSIYIKNVSLLMRTISCQIDIAKSETYEDYTGESEQYAAALKECQTDMHSLDDIMLSLLNAYLSKEQQ